ncbi:MAG: hypothetical protein P1V35_13780, partial [Planctomycetota bacterium]|nr:hypothetical protein [Planctomycetota bacterium]
MNPIAMLLQNDAWHGVGHATPKFGDSWGPMEWVGLAATVLLGVGLVALIAIAIARNSRYRAVGVVSEGELELVRNKIADVEKRTTGEVMVVLLERSDRHPAAHWLAALSLLFVGSVLLWTWLPWGDPVLLL